MDVVVAIVRAVSIGRLELWIIVVLFILWLVVLVCKRWLQSRYRCGIHWLHRRSKLIIAPNRTKQIKTGNFVSVQVLITIHITALCIWVKGTRRSKDLALLLDWEGRVSLQLSLHWTVNLFLYHPLDIFHGVIQRSHIRIYQFVWSKLRTTLSSKDCSRRVLMITPKEDTLTYIGSVWMQRLRKPFQTWSSTCLYRAHSTFAIQFDQFSLFFRGLKNKVRIGIVRIQSRTINNLAA